MAIRRRLAASLGVLALCLQMPVLAQRLSSIPFVGCRSEGQIGPVDAPQGDSRMLPIAQRLAKQLSSYASAQGLMVLAPRGWSGFGVYGSGGETLLLSAQPIDRTKIFSGLKLTGGVAVFSRAYGDTSGRDIVAEVVARVFPAFRRIAVAWMELFEPKDPLTFVQYPNDKLLYKNNAAVEFTTPAGTRGLGTNPAFENDGDAIRGVAMLVGGTPDLLLLSLRLPADMDELTRVIVEQAERDAAKSISQPQF